MLVLVGLSSLTPSTLFSPLPPCCFHSKSNAPPVEAQTIRLRLGHSSSDAPASSQILVWRSLRERWCLASYQVLIGKRRLDTGRREEQQPRSHPAPFCSDPDTGSGAQRSRCGDQNLQRLASTVSRHSTPKSSKSTVVQTDHCTHPPCPRLSLHDPTSKFRRVWSDRHLLPAETPDGIPTLVPSLTEAHFRPVWPQLRLSPGAKFASWPQSRLLALMQWRQRRTQMLQCPSCPHLVSRSTFVSSNHLSPCLIPGLSLAVAFFSKLSPSFHISWLEILLLLLVPPHSITPHAQSQPA